MRGGDLVVKGRVGARSGIDQKGGTIIVLGHAGSITGFMMQRGRQISAATWRGAGRLHVRRNDLVGGKVKSLGIDCVARRVERRRHRARSSASSASTASARRPQLQKFVCGKKLYNYDTLEPSERKLVL